MLSHRSSFLLALLFYSLVQAVQSAPAAPAAPVAEPLPTVGVGADKEVRLCYSTQEYIEALEFLRGKEMASMRDEISRELAEHVSQGCDGSAKRFKDTYRLLIKSGVDHTRTLKIALEFSQLKPAIQENFFAIFKYAYLGEFLDFHFSLALRMAYEFSKNQRAYPERAKKDFKSFVAFCLNSNKLSIPMSACGPMISELMRLSPHYAGGIFEPFEQFHDLLIAKGRFGLSVQDSLDVIVRVLKYGPRASTNFHKGYNYAMSKEGLRYPASKALKFALRMARYSATGSPLPLAKSKEEIAREKVK